MTTTIKITELTNIGANLDGSTVFPVVNMSGTPTTQKTVLGNIANTIFAGAGTDYVSVASAVTATNATVATRAGTVTTAAQPNITSTGNLTGLTVSNASGVVNFTTTANVTLGAVGNLHIAGGSNGQVLTTNGSGGLSWTSSSGSANTGNIGFNDNIIYSLDGSYLDNSDLTHDASAAFIIPTNGGGNVEVNNTYGNILIQTGVDGTFTGIWNFDNTGNLQVPGNIVGPASANFTIYANAGAHEFVFGDDGTFYAPDNVVLGGNSIYIGPGANTLDGIEHEVFIASSNLFPYVQAVINNISDQGSADWVALGARGGDEGGTTSFGFTSSGFSDGNYTITGHGDGYVLVQSYAPGQTLLGGGGNLVLATGSQGTTKDIIFGTGGFLTANIFGRISDANNSLELTRTGASLTFPDGSIQTTAYTGGGSGNTGNVTFNGNVISTSGTNDLLINLNGQDFIANTSNGGAIGLYSGNSQIAINNNTPGIEITSLNVNLVALANGDINLDATAANGVVDIESAGNTTITANGNVWTFGSTGVLSKNDANGLVLAANYSAQIITDFGDNDRTWLFDGSSGELVLPGGNVLIDPSDDNFEVRGAENINFEANAVVNIYTDSGNNGFQWQFGDDGSIIFPTLTVDIHNGGNQTAQTLQFGDPEQQAIITGPTPDADTNAQRLIIQGQRGSGTGEGGDVYVWAGDSDTGGGDIKIYAGDADSNTSGSGGYVNIDGGAGFDNGGDITLTGGVSANSDGGSVSLAGGQGQVDGGPINIQGGYGATGQGGRVNILGGSSSLGQSAYGNVEIGSGTYAWIFDNSGNLTLPSNDFTVNYANGTQVNIDGGGANTGNVTFDDVTIQGDNNSLNLSAGADFTANLAYLQVRAGDVSTHIHLDTGNNEAYDQYFGDDSKFVKLGLGIAGNVSIGTYQDGGVGQLEWTFDSNGNLVLPRGGVVYETNIPFGGLEGNTIALIPSGGTNADQQLLVYPTAGQDFNHLHLTSGNLYNTELFLGNDNFYVKLANTGNIIINTNDDAGNTAQWSFNTDGSILSSDSMTLEVPNGVPSAVTDITNTSGSWESNPSSNLATTGGSGTGLTVNVSNDGGYASSIAIATPGTGYTDGDTIDVTSGSSSATFTISVVRNEWTFGTAGNLNMPGNISVGGTTSITATNDSGSPGGPGGPTFTAELNANPGIDDIQLGWTVTGNNLVGVTTVTAISVVGPVYEFYTDTGVTNPFEYNSDYTFTSPGATWSYDNTGSLTLPSISLGNSQNEETVIQSQRKIIPGFRYSVEIDGSTPTVVYTATDNTITSMKVTIQIQHTGLGFEFFDVSATSAGNDTYYTVSNRLQPPGITDSTVVVDMNGSNTMEITVTINSGAETSWVTYDATEFGISVD